MVRLLDISDTYLGKSRGHPSDMTSGLVALAEAVARGREIAHQRDRARLRRLLQLREVGRHQFERLGPAGLQRAWAASLGAAKLLGLDARADGATPSSLALAPNMALAQSRRGHLSSWKGCAGANASRNAVFAALLAKDGFTGPTAVFEGDGGMCRGDRQVRLAAAREART